MSKFYINNVEHECITYELARRAKRASVRDAIDRDLFDIITMGDRYYIERVHRLWPRLVKSIELEMRVCFPGLKSIYER
jgi:hypothetical protein